MLPRFLANTGTREATREVLGEWLERSPWAERLLERIFARTLAKRRVEEYAIGVKQGREEGIAETLAWVERRDAARENDEPFDEPSPGRREPKH